MSITTLYAELVVVGTGALLFILMSSYAFFDDLSFVTKFPTNALGATIVLIPLLSVVYLLGIIVASVSHGIFDGLELRLREEALGKIDYGQLRNKLYTSPNVQNLVHDFEFRRSKVRICRGWYVNSILIMVALLACFGTGRISLSTTIFGCVAFGLLAAGTFMSWRIATTTELDWMKSFAEQPKAQSAKQALPPFIDG